MSIREPHPSRIEVLRYAAFLKDGRGGNPAGVVLEADGLTDGERLSVARRMGYSESAFLDRDSGGTLRLQYFSPVAEVAFCGHATVATAVAMAHRFGPGAMVFRTAAGPVGVDTARVKGGTSATLTSPATSTRAAAPPVTASALQALHWSPKDLDPALAPHIAFGGNHHLVLAARTRQRLADLDYDYNALASFMRELGLTTVDLVWRESSHLFHCRNPFPTGGIVEDPATGAAAAALGGYLRAMKAVELPAEITILQGQDMGSPSRLGIRLAVDDSRVRVTGVAQQLGPAILLAAGSP